MRPFVYLPTVSCARLCVSGPPPAAAVTDVSSPSDLAGGSRKVVVEFRPEDRGGASAISRSTYDPANPLPLNGLVLYATRSTGALTYNLTAVSDSQPRFYIRGQKAGGQQVYLQVLGLSWQPLTEDSPEVEAWFDGLQFSDSAWRPAGQPVATAAFVPAVAGMLAGLTVAAKAYKLCRKVWFIKKKCKGWLEGKAIKLFFGWLGAKATQFAHDFIHGSTECSKPLIRKAWRAMGWGKNPPPGRVRCGRVDQPLRVALCGDSSLGATGYCRLYCGLTCLLW